MRITVIGSGNTATVLARALKGAGHAVPEIYSRNLKHAEILAGKIGARAIRTLAELSSETDLFLIAISDTALSSWADDGIRLARPAVHTAGTVPMNVLETVSSQYGIFYPLQTLRKEAELSPVFPLLIDGSNEVVKKTLFDLASSLSEQVIFANDEQRRRYHLAAVIANNFSNHLLTLTDDFCKKENIDFSMLYPLIREGAKRATETSPVELQTGPAIRGDDNTITKQRELLLHYPMLLTLYDQFTKSIRERK